MLLRAILILILVTLLARLFWRVVDGVIEGVGGQSRRRMRPAERLVRDPVCGTYLRREPRLSLTAGDATHYFCSEACRDKYLKPR
jgi:YHS domain-containing protein